MPDLQTSDLKSAQDNSLWAKITGFMIAVIAIGMALFHLYTASIGVLTPYFQTAVHWALVGSFIVLAKPYKFPGGRIIDIIFILGNIFISYYLLVLQERAILFAGLFTRTDVIISIFAVVWGLLIARRVLGNILPIICIVFIAYGLLGHNLTGIFHTSRFSVQRLFTDIYSNVASGMYGQTLFVSAQFIFLFVLFGSFLQLTGAGAFFVDLAFSLTGKIRGGPAQASIFSTMLIGTIQGSGAANVVTTGPFTIPLMKKVGYTPSMAGGVEAAASAGAQVVPPVMGAVAFLMSEITGIPYVTIALAAVIPSVLYFITLSATVYFTAHKDNIPVAKEEQIRKFKDVIKAGWIYFLPLITLVTLLLLNYSVRRAAFFAIIAVIVVGFIKNPKNMTLKKLLGAATEAVKGIAPIAAACLLAGIIMNVINLTGLGLRISGIIVHFADGRLLVALILCMVTSLILGMGLPTSAAYIILAIIVAPAMINMGATQLSAHLFILYFACLTTITPPVALSTFAAAAIAGSGIWETCRDAIRLACTGFIIPFIFVYQSAILLDGPLHLIIYSAITAAIGCVILATSLVGWAGLKLNIIARIIIFPCAILLFLPQSAILNFTGLLVAGIIIIVYNFIPKIKARQV